MRTARSLWSPCFLIALLSIKITAIDVYAIGMLTSSALTLFIIPLMYYDNQRSSRKLEQTPVNEKQLVADN